MLTCRAAQISFGIGKVRPCSVRSFTKLASSWPFTWASPAHLVDGYDRRRRRLKRMVIVGRFEPLARGRGRSIVSTDREWLHRVDSGPSPTPPSTARLRLKRPFLKPLWALSADSAISVF